MTCLTEGSVFSSPRQMGWTSKEPTSLEFYATVKSQWKVETKCENDSLSTGSKDRTHGSAAQLGGERKKVGDSRRR